MLRDTLLRTAERGLYRVHWSTQILDEVTRNLVAQGRVNEAGAKRLVQHMSSTFPEALVEGHESLVTAMENDPKDRHVVAAAVRCHAQVVVTSNLRDFPEEALDPYGIEAQSPDEFLCNLLDLDQSAVFRVIIEQAADLHNPPRTALDVLAALSSFSPEFAQIVRALLPPALGGPPQELS